MRHPSDMHLPFVSAADLHDAAELLRTEHPEGSPQGMEQANAIADFMFDSDWSVREEDGSTEAQWEPHLPSFGYGLMIGLIAGRRAK